MQVAHADRLRMLIPTYMAVAGRTRCPDIGPMTGPCDEDLQREILRRRPGGR